jgi:hypothetical protein
MANTTISPNMGMPVPTVGVDPGPDYATNVNASLSIIDSHNHSPGQGVPITPAGININANLAINSNNVTSVRTINYQAQNSPIAASAPDIGCTYVSGVDLYYNDESGNQIRMTQGGAVAGSAGTITGLPSGTASAAYATGTFTFLEATSTPAGLNVGPVTIGQSVAGTNTVTIAPNAAQPTNYNLTLPAALPSTTNYMTLNSSGQISFNSAGVTGTGPLVLQASPTLTGTVTVGTGGITFNSGTMVDYEEFTWTPTLSTTNGTSVTDVGSWQKVGNVVTCRILLSFTPINGDTSVTTFTLPLSPNNNFSAAHQLIGTCGGGNFYTSSTSYFTVNSIVATTSARTGKISVTGYGASGIQVPMIFIYYLNN